MTADRRRRAGSRRRLAATRSRRFTERVWRLIRSGWKGGVALAGGILAFVAAATLGIGVYQRTFGADAVAQHRLDRLAVNLQIDRFIDRLGKPDLINSDGTFTERLFIDSR